MPKARVNGISLNYNVEGQGEPIILMMGCGGPGRAWFFQTRVFKKHYKVVTFDARDAAFGKTDNPSEPYTMKTLADDTIGLMDHLGIDRAHILGFSMGGMIAQELAINYPERVQKLVLASTVSSPSQIAPALLGLFGLHEDFSEGDWASVDVRQGFGSATALAFNSRLYRMLVGLLFPISDRLGWFERLKGQRGAVAGCDTIDRLHTIRAPTLVIVGTKERCVQLHASEVMASRIPNAKLVKVDGATHAQIFEMRSRFNKEVLDFLKSG